jgi:hypothetical protein
LREMVIICPVSLSFFVSCASIVRMGWPRCSKTEVLCLSTSLFVANICKAKSG